VLIPLVILKTNKRIKKLKEDVENSGKITNELLNKALSQTDCLNKLFKDWDCIEIIEKTVPLLKFKPSFSVEQESNMTINFDFETSGSAEQSTLDVLSGEYNENPFLFENKVTHTMGTEVYHGYKTIHWTESYIDGNGKRKTRIQSQTLHATLTKPKPFFNTQVMLNYCAQGGPDLSFTRDATNLDKKSEKQLERYIKKGEKRLEKISSRALKQNRDFTSMANSEFEVLFDALDRTDEVQFRTLFTPLAQTNMVDLILSKTGYGDDFNFIKQKRTNRIVSNHSQGRNIILPASTHFSHSFDIIKESFINKNTEFFRAVYFDFAPVLAIPIYQERPVHSLKPIPDYDRNYSAKEAEALANRVNKSYTTHPDSKTQAILKSTFLKSENLVDNILITAYSYNIIQRTEYVSVYGGDKRWHEVAVKWDDYIPLESTNNFYIATQELSKDKNVVAQRNNLCIFN
jgi:hypothetical protein